MKLRELVYRFSLLSEQKDIAEFEEG